MEQIHGRLHAIESLLMVVIDSLEKRHRQRVAERFAQRIEIVRTAGLASENTDSQLAAVEAHRARLAEELLTLL